jgi:myo-inositol-hexaphosphate 3-phosphohydrolase
MSAFAGAMMNQIYEIQVAANINGVWSQYGDTCTITYGTVSATKVAHEMNDLEVTTYPNPSSSHFNIQFNQTIEKADLSVYDISGKLIQNLNLNGVQNLEFGNDLNSGVYLVKITSDKFVKTFRLVKN